MTITEARSRAAHSVNATLAQGGDVAGQVRTAVGDAFEHLPDAVDMARTGAQETTATLQTMKDPTLELLAVASIGLAGGLYLAGSRRVVTLAAVVPALIVGVAILTRPGRRHGAR
jgi:hypothetical protein